MWYDFRWYSRRRLTARVLRIFDRGNREEPVIVRRLRSAGISVRDVDEDNAQFGFSTFDGHFKGCADGIVALPDRLSALTGLKGDGLLEIKTMNAKKFRKMNKEEAIPISHYDQMQAYMHYFELKWGLHVCACKDDDQWSFTVIPYSESQAAAASSSAPNRRHTMAPPPKITAQFERIIDDGRSALEQTRDNAAVLAAEVSKYLGYHGRSIEDLWQAVNGQHERLGELAARLDALESRIADRLDSLDQRAQALAEQTSTMAELGANAADNLVGTIEVIDKLDARVGRLANRVRRLDGGLPG